MPLKAYVIGGICAALLALYLLCRWSEARAVIAQAQTRRVEIRRENPIIHAGWLKRLREARSKGEAFTEAEPSGIETVSLELKPGETQSFADLEITLVEESSK